MPAETYLLPARRGIAFSAVATVTVLMLSMTQAGAEPQLQSPANATPRSNSGLEAQKQVVRLSEILDQLDWDPAAQGPLLIVAPAKAELLRDNSASTDGRGDRNQRRGLKSPSPRGYRLTVIDGEFGRKVTPLGSLTTVVPTVMTVLHHRDLPAPDAYAGLTQDTRERLLFSSLTSAQWNRLTQPEGIGTADLNVDQRRLFLGLLPDPFMVLVAQPGAGPNGQPVLKQVTLSSTQVQTVRIALQPTLSWTFGLADNPDSSVGIVMDSFSQTRPTLNLIVQSQSPMSQRELLYGVRLREEVPNRAKPGHLNFEAAALAKRVSLSGAATVGELVQRVAAASGLELYADRRYQGLPVYVRGDSARAGDVLKALTLSVSGTVRRIQNSSQETTYVLTDDLEGLAQRHARIRSWVRSATQQVAATLQEAEGRLTALQSERKEIPWTNSTEDAMLPDAALRRKIDGHLEKLRNYPARVSGKLTDAWEKYKAGKELWVPVTELPADAQERVKDQINVYKSGSPGEEKSQLRTDAVRLDVQITPIYLIPGMGKIPAPGLRMGRSDSVFNRTVADAEMQAMNAARAEADRQTRLKAEREQVALPWSFPRGTYTRALLVTVKDAEEAKQAAEGARARGLNQLWLAVSPDSNPDTLREQVEAAKKAASGLAVFAEVRVLRWPSDSSQSRTLLTADTATGAREAADRNVLDESLTEYIARRAQETAAPEETRERKAARALAHEKGVGDLARCDVAEANKHRIARITALARTPGLDGLTLRDLYAPGYMSSVSSEGLDTLSLDQEPDSELGYTPDLRLEFLRRYGCDPVDLLKTGDQEMMNSISLPDAAASLFVPLELRLPFFQDNGRRTQDASGNEDSPIPPEAPSTNEQWPRLLYETNAAFQNLLLRSLQGRVTSGTVATSISGNASRTSLRLLREGQPGWADIQSAQERRYVSWSMPLETKLPVNEAPLKHESVIRVIPYDSQEKRYPGATPPERFARQIAWIVTGDPARPGRATAPTEEVRPGDFVLDLSDASLSEALALLTQLRASKD